MLRVFAYFILLLPLVTNHWFYEPYELPKIILFYILSIPLFLYSTYLFLLDVWFVATRRKHIRILLIPVIYLALLASLLFSSAINNALPYGLWGQPYRYQGIIFFLLCGSLAYAIPRIKISLQNASMIIACMGVVSCLIIIFDTAMILIWPSSVPSYAGRPVGAFGNPNFAAGYIALCFVFVYRIWGRKKWFSASLILFTLALVGTRSLSGASSFLVVLVTLLFPRFKKRILLAGFILLLLGSLMVISYSSRTPSSFDRRSSLWEKSLLAFKDKPLMGWGAENFAEAFQKYVRPEEIHLTHIRVDKPHNDILEIMVTGGMISALLLLLLCLSTFKPVYKKARQDGDYTFLALWLGFFVYGFWNVHSVTHFILLFYAIGFLSRQDNLNKPNTSTTS